MKQVYYVAIAGICAIAAAVFVKDSPLRLGPPVVDRTVSAPTVTTVETVPEPSPPPEPVLPVNIDPAASATVDRYVDSLSNIGLDPQQQGVWIQTAAALVAEHEGKQRFPAASLTKLATTLAALDYWDANYRFYTRIGTNGSLENGVLNGDLIVLGGGDPFYVWETGITLGNELNRLGIETVNGRLIIGGLFVMNFERDRAIAGELLRQALNADLWNYEAYTQYQTLPEETPEPRVVIQQGVAIDSNLTPDTVPVFLEQPSLPLVDILKLMNSYSNNPMADLLADLLGGGAALTEQTAELAGVPLAEVQFINGSGLGHENQMSARAACNVLNAISETLEPDNLGLRDVLPIIDQDPGTLEIRELPTGTMAKTGTLWDVSALTGLVPSQGQPLKALEQDDDFCFAIINRGANLDFLYTAQEDLLKALQTDLQNPPANQATRLEPNLQPAN